jgi:hypothetical protein
LEVDNFHYELVISALRSIPSSSSLASLGRKKAGVGTTRTIVTGRLWFKMLKQFQTFRSFQ